MKLGQLIEEELYFKCHMAWLFGASKSAIWAMRPTSIDYIQITEVSRGLTKCKIELNLLGIHTVVIFEWFFHPQFN